MNFMIFLSALIFVIFHIQCSEACVDASASCPTWVSNGFCTNTFYTTAQRCQYCPASCSSLGCCSSSGGTGGTGTGTCINADSSCTTWVSNGFCTNTFYTVAQRCQYCASSCSSLGCCSSSGTSCTDADSRCTTWVSNGFCSSTFYTAAQKCQYCANSCNMCSSCASAATTEVAGGTTAAGETVAGATTESGMSTT